MVYIGIASSAARAAHKRRAQPNRRVPNFRIAEIDGSMMLVFSPSEFPQTPERYQLRFLNGEKGLGRRHQSVISQMQMDVRLVRTQTFESL